MEKFIRYSLALTFIFLFLMGDILVLVYFGHGTWYGRLGFVLEIIGFYGIGIGLVQGSDMLKNFDGLDDMTSPNPVKFLAGNFLFLSILSSMIFVGLDSNRSKNKSIELGFVGQIIIMFFAPPLLIYFFVHLILICPFAYIGYFFSSALVESVAGASGDMEHTVTSADGKSQSISIKNVIASNPTAAKSFLIGLPALLLSFITNTIGMFAG